jgi:hypothetical protein
MRILGRCDLGGRGNGGEGMGLREGGGRRTLFIAHESPPVNFTVVDVTDPRRPAVLHQEELPHREVRSNSLSLRGDLLAVAYQVQRPGARPAGLELFDVSVPERPRRLGFLDTSGPHSRGMHFVWLSDSLAFCATGMPDFEPAHPLDDQFVLIVDVSDPGRPYEVGRWWLPGTRRGEEPVRRHPQQDRGFRAHNVNVYPERPERAYVGYLDGGVVVLDIADLAHPRLVSQLDYHPPLPGFTHTVLPLLGRDLLAVTDEAVTDGCQDHPKLVWIVDASYEPNLVPIATCPMPPAEEYCGRGGRFGAHNLHENDPVPTAWRSERTLIGAFFNAGVRLYDLADPFQPQERAHLIPAAPPKSPAGAVQINDVYVDERGLIYAVDRFTGGLYVIECSQGGLA